MHAKRLRKTHQDHRAGVGASALDATEILVVEARFLGEKLLRQLPGLAQSPDAFCERAEDWQNLRSFAFSA